MFALAMYTCTVFLVMFTVVRMFERNKSNELIMVIDIVAGILVVFAPVMFDLATRNHTYAVATSSLLLIVLLTAYLKYLSNLKGNQK
jgi:drug/metabolite transporter (DMT)-like permease